MHQTGSQMWTTLYRNDTFEQVTNRIEYYSFDAQQQTRVNYTINPGDKLNVHCIYDTTGRTTPTFFGVESDDEMCMDFVSYYPRMDFFNGSDFAHCTYAKLGAPGNYTFCGAPEYFSMGVIMGFNPTFSDIAEGEARAFGAPVTDGCKTYANRAAVVAGVMIGLVALIAIGIVAGVLYFRWKKNGYQVINDGKVLM